jgi:lipoprotein NlpD
MNKTLRSTDLPGVTSALAFLCCLLAGCVNSQAPVPEPGAEQIANAAQAASAQQASVLAGYYRVNEGDTVESIAAAYGRDPAALANWNDISAYPALPAGQVLRVSPPPDAAGVPPALPAASAVAASPSNVTPAPVASNSPVVAAPRPAARAASAPACSADALAWPAQGPLVGTFGKNGAHGILIGGKSGDAVKAADSGRVVYAGNRVKGYGQLVIVKHGDHYLTAYGYNQKLLVKEGAKVRQGQIIAEMGNVSGRSSLLFEVRKDRKPVDPLPYLKRCL